MEVFRISKSAHSNLEGLGGLYYPGRWHEVGYKVIYTAQHRSLAALEYLVHLSSTSFLQTDFVISTIYIPDKTQFETVSNKTLSNGWANIQKVGTTRRMGTDFLKNKIGLYLKVPSAVIEDEFNYILNPNHPDMKNCRIINAKPFQFDDRLVK